MPKKQYVQFSKRVVIAVCIAVTIISVLVIILDFASGGMSYATDIVKVYIQFAMVVFAAYTGNSAIQKWLIKKYTPKFFSDSDTSSLESQEQSSNG